MCAFQLFVCVDPSLGHVDYSSFSDQTLMEMLIEGFDDVTKSEYQESDGTYLNFCRKSCITCDHDESVLEIDIDSENASGIIDLCYVPPKVKFLNISTLAKSELTGSVHLTHLPEGMQTLILSENQLAGEIDLKRLPDGMNVLDLHRNQLTGEINLTRLPEGLSHLFLSNNQFTGEIDLTQLPEGMQRLHLDNNQLTGSLIILNLPPGIDLIKAYVNHFNAVAVIDSKARARISVCRSGVKSVVDENGRKRSAKQFLR